MNKKILLNIFCALFFLLRFACAETLDISGIWRLSLNKKDSMKSEGEIRLPGDLASQGYGFKPSPQTRWLGGPKTALVESEKFSKYLKSNAEFKMPFFLQPDIHFIGIATFEKEIEINSDISKHAYNLYLERPHFKTQLLINNQLVGESVRIGTAHEYDISSFVKKGKNLITIKVDNSSLIDGIGSYSHSVTDNSQGNWNGIVGKMFIEISPQLYIDDAQIFFLGGEEKSAMLRLSLANSKDFKGVAELYFSASPRGNTSGKRIQKTFKIEISGDKKSFNFNLDFGKDAPLWSEYAPNLYDLEISLKSPLGESKKTFSYGLRKIEVKDKKILVNGRETFLRGTLECALFPLTTYPPTDKAAWIRIMQTCKKYGINHLRFHSWCPPSAAFEAADEIGIYLQPENSNWAHSLGDGAPVESWIYEESKAMLRAYGNHPSFVFYCQGNEPSGKSDERRDAYLKKWVETFKAEDSRRLYSAGAGWPALSQNDFTISAMPRLQKFWGDCAKSIINTQAPSTNYDYENFASKCSLPLITHEMGQWCAYPDFESEKKYTGNLKPKSFEVLMDFMKSANLQNQAKDFLMASGKLQLLLYKAEIEAALRTKSLCGFQLLDLRDFPGQGTALVGVLDPFWESKGYADEKDFSKFCNDIVPLALLPKLVYAKGEVIDFEIKLSNYSENELKGAKVICQILGKDGKKYFEKSYISDFPRGLSDGNNIKIPSANFESPDCVTLKISVEYLDKQRSNDWNLWCFAPQEIGEIKGVKIFDNVDENFVAATNSGGKIWLKLKPDLKLAAEKFKFGFTPAFWNTVWTEGRLPPETLGLLCNPKHSIFKFFPTSYHSDYQWWEVVKNSCPIDMTHTKIPPLIQVIPDYFNPKKYALTYEAKIGNAKVLVTNINFDAEKPNLCLKQLKTSISKYLSSADFSPKETLSIADLNSK